MDSIFLNEKLRTKLKENRIKIKLERYNFFQKSISCWNFIIDAGDLHPSPDKVVAVQNTGISENKTELK